MSNASFEDGNLQRTRCARSRVFPGFSFSRLTVRVISPKPGYRLHPCCPHPLPRHVSLNQTCKCRKNYKEGTEIYLNMVQVCLLDTHSVGFLEAVNTNPCPGTSLKLLPGFLTATPSTRGTRASAFDHPQVESIQPRR